MSIAGQELLTQKELCLRWGVCLRTVQSERKRWGLRPARFLGLMPLFAPAAVLAAERRRDTARLVQNRDFAGV
jgi:hypothetical protein